MTLQTKPEPVLGFPMDEGRFSALIEIIGAEQREFNAEPDLVQAEDASVRMVAHLLGCDYLDAQSLVSQAIGRGMDALCQAEGIKPFDPDWSPEQLAEHEQIVNDLINVSAEKLMTLVFTWLDGMVLALRYADVAYRQKVLDQAEETD